eukprot:CAMPEP_0116917662 /NCGR_PEP_ID=MMETSP0467-20121206/19292_1 /TAXON_ID=283647 /ORGANISM="Mesodinium pulex, Strain SPMC105" /LENGTH=132 /DNA_ID=CAMNT_0004594829 /DNA_START=222 /DNA_END=620 /DNA_ORIENTATION=+
MAQDMKVSFVLGLVNGIENTDVTPELANCMNELVPAALGGLDIVQQLKHFNLQAIKAIANDVSGMVDQITEALAVCKQNDAPALTLVNDLKALKAELENKDNFLKIVGNVFENLDNIKDEIKAIKADEASKS